MLGLFTSPFFIAFLAALTVFILWKALTQRGREAARTAAERRLDSVMAQSGTYENDDSVNMDIMEDAKPSLIEKMVKSLSQQGTFEALEQGDILAYISKKLKLAGYPKGWDAKDFISFYILIMGGAGFAAIMMYSAHMPKIIMAGVLIVAAAYPFAWLNRLIHERQDKIFAELPDVLDEMVLALSSGIGTLEGAIEEVVTDANDDALKTGKKRILASEFERAYREYRHGNRDWEEAFDAAADRTGLPEIVSLVEGLNEAKRGGAPIRQVLDDMSSHIYSIYQTKMLEFIEKKSTGFVVSLSGIMIGVLIIIIAPIFAEILASLSG